MPEGVEFPFPSLLFYEGQTYTDDLWLSISAPFIKKQ